MSKRILEAYKQIDEVGLAATKVGSYSHVRYCDRASYDVSLSNGVGFTSVFTVDGSHDGVTWFNIETPAPMALDGASAYVRYNIERVDYSLFRPTITVTAGTGDVVAILTAHSLSN